MRRTLGYLVDSGFGALSRIRQKGNAAMRLRRLQEEFAGSLDIEWRSFLLRPHPGQIPRDLGQFREYTKSWRRPAEQGDRGTFREWATDEGPPSHSVPPHERIAAEHNEAIQLGVNGVPAVRLADNEVPFMGAHPIEVYRQWVQKALDAGGTSE